MEKILSETELDDLTRQLEIKCAVWLIKLLADFPELFNLPPKKELVRCKCWREFEYNDICACGGWIY